MKTWMLGRSLGSSWRLSWASTMTAWMTSKGEPGMQPWMQQMTYVMAAGGKCVRCSTVCPAYACKGCSRALQLVPHYTKCEQREWRSTQPGRYWLQPQARAQACPLLAPDGGQGYLSQVSSTAPCLCVMSCCVQAAYLPLLPASVLLGKEAAAAAQGEARGTDSTPLGGERSRRSTLCWEGCGWLQ